MAFKDILNSIRGDRPAGHSMAGQSYELYTSAWDADTSPIWGAFPKENVRDDTTLHDRYEQAYFSSPLATLLVDHLNSFLNNYKFVPGPEGTEDDVRDVELHFKNTDSHEKLLQATIQAIVLGTGTAQLVTRGDSVDDEEGMQLIDTKSLTFRAERQDDGTFEEIIEQQGQELNIDNLLLLRLKRYPGRVQGISMMTSVLFSLEAMNDLIEDIPAAIKQLAYVQRIAKLDLEGVDTQEEKETIMQDMTAKFSRINTAKSSVATIDKRHDLGIMGNVSGAGGGQSRIIPIRDLIEPLVAWTMLNFNMGLGHILQTGANKALLEQQESRIRVAMDQLRKNWARQVEKQYLDRITGEDTVKIVHIDDNNETREEKKVALEEVKNSLMTTNEYRQKFNVGPPVEGGDEINNENSDAEDVSQSDTESGDEDANNNETEESPPGQGDG